MAGRPVIFGAKGEARSEVCGAVACSHARVPRADLSRAYHVGMSEHRLPERDRPWVMRTYAGHSDARRSNELYRKNLAKGQTGLSVAFDLPTQTGYDPDAELARGEVGKVGVSIVAQGRHAHAFRRDPTRRDEHLDDDQRHRRLAARALRNGRRGERRRARRAAGTTQNDIIKEYLSRGTYAFPPGPSMRLIADTVAFTVNEIPKWNPINVCSYHLQEAGATPVQEIAYALSTAIAVLDEVKARGQVGRRGLSQGLRPHLVLRQRRGPVHRGARQAARHGRDVGVDRPQPLRGDRAEVPAPPLRRPGQLARPDRVPAGEQRAPDRARSACRDPRPRRPCPSDPATGLERGARPPPPLGSAVEPADPADPRQRDRPARLPRHLRGLEGDGRRWSTELAEAAKAEMKAVEEQGGAVEAVPYMKARLVESNRERIAKIERGEIKVVGPEQVHRDRGFAAHRRRGRRHPHSRSRGRARADRGSGGVAGTARSGSRRHGSREARRGRPRREREHHAGDHRGRQGRRHHRRVGGRAA